MRYELIGEHVDHGAGVVVCRGELPESTETRACSEFLPISILTTFSSAGKRALSFHVATTVADATKRSWLEWTDTEKNSAVLHVQLHTSSFSDAYKFDALSAERFENPPFLTLPHLLFLGASVKSVLTYLNVELSIHHSTNELLNKP